jgi:hypothetical protein
MSDLTFTLLFPPFNDLLNYVDFFASRSVFLKCLSTEKQEKKITEHGLFFLKKKKRNANVLLFPYIPALIFIIFLYLFLAI